MSRESILKVKEAEARAERIVEEAKERAHAMIESAQKEGIALCARTEENAVRESKASMQLLREKTAETLERVNADAEQEVEAMRKEAFLRKRSAEKIVIRGLMSKCR